MNGREARIVRSCGERGRGSSGNPLKLPRRQRADPTPPLRARRSGSQAARAAAGNDTRTLAQSQTNQHLPPLSLPPCASPTHQHQQQQQHQQSSGQAKGASSPKHNHARKGRRQGKAPQGGACMRARARATQAVCSGARGTERDRERARDFSLVQPHSSNGSPFAPATNPLPTPPIPQNPTHRPRRTPRTTTSRTSRSWPRRRR